MAEAIAKKLLLVGWDAADWEIIHPIMDAGRMPNLKRVVEGGVMGNLLTLQPILSPILWTSIATGKRAYHHGITGFVEPTPDATALRPISSSTRKCKALWNILSQATKRCHAVGWYASHPAEIINGVYISQEFSIAPASATPDKWPPQPNSVQPVELAQSLADLRVHPREISGRTLLQFIPAAGRLDQRDPEVRRLLNAFGRRIAECISLHAITTAVMEEPWDFCTAYYEAIDNIGHDFMAFHPPRMDHVRPDLFEIFQGVMVTIYELQDQMLGRLMELAGPDAHVMVVSDHGFLNDARRPVGDVDPAVWHRNFGILALSGPGIKKDDIVHGATLLDIAPTILTLFGLPVGQDMEGKVLVTAFEKAPEIERIPSWEEVRDEKFDAKPASTIADDPEAAAAALHQLVELGYLQAPGENIQRDIARARAEQKFNLACAYVDGKQPARAVVLAEELVNESPREPRYIVLAGQSAVSACDTAALCRAIDALEVVKPDAKQLPMFKAFHCWLTNDIAGALEYFKVAAVNEPNDSWLMCRIGRAYLRLRRWREAEEAFRNTIELDPDNAESYYGLSVALPRQGKLEEGVQCGLQAISLFHDFPLAHFQLGAVLSRLGWYERALQAFEICLVMNPDFALAHRYVSMIAANLGLAEVADKHRQTARQLLAKAVPQPAVD